MTISKFSNLISISDVKTQSPIKSLLRVYGGFNSDLVQTPTTEVVRGDSRMPILVLVLAIVSVSHTSREFSDKIAYESGGIRANSSSVRRPTRYQKRFLCNQIEAKIMPIDHME